MKRARVFVDDDLAGYLIEWEQGKRYEFSYLDTYKGPSVSLTMPCEQKTYRFERFPPFFEGLLPEGIMLELLCRKVKIDARDFFEQLMWVGRGVIGNVTVERDA